MLCSNSNWLGRTAPAARLALAQRRTSRPSSCLSGSSQRRLLKRGAFTSSYYYYCLAVSSVFAVHAKAYSSWSNNNIDTMSHITERDGSGTITLTPKNEADTSALLVICHGLGDTSDGFDDVAEHLARKVPHMKIILPTAPTQPVTMNMGMSMPSWYDIKGLDMRSNEDCAGIDDSQRRLEQILETEHETSGLPYSRMVLGGFSQGGALCLYTGMQLKPGPDKKLAAIIVLSGYLAQQSKFQITPGLEDTPVLHLHGTQDPVVQFPMAELSHKAMTQIKGATNYQLKSYPVQHTVSVEEIAAMEEFLIQRLPHDDSCKIKLKDPKEMSIKELRAAIKKAGLSQQAVGFMEKSEFVRLIQDHRNGKL